MNNGKHRLQGFTLIEVLAALSVLAFGLTAVIGLFMGSIRHGRVASDRTSAMIMIPDAVRQIEMDHLITVEMAGPSGIPAGEIGLFVQTLEFAEQSNHFAPTDNIYQNIRLNGKKLKQADELKDTNLCEWPRRPAKGIQIGGNTYRVLYRLEKHPNWQPHDNDGDHTSAENLSSPYLGVYVLTLSCYRAPDEKIENWTQINDPMIQLLRDRKQR